MTPVPKPTPALKEPRTLKQRVHRIPRHVRAMVLARDNMTCRWCKRPGGALDPHHILRRSQGGTDDQANLVSLHRLCHSYVHEHPAEAKARGFLA
jgi:5-methylcytosine-specific restriction protein A